jgi:hypothetical protein
MYEGGGDKVPENEHAVKDALDDVGRVLEGLEAHDVLGGDAV